MDLLKKDTRLEQSKQWRTFPVRSELPRKNPVSNSKPRSLVFTSDSQVVVRVGEPQNHPGGDDPAVTLALVKPHHPSSTAPVQQSHEEPLRRVSTRFICSGSF